jgi:hypothetical protein
MLMVKTPRRTGMEEKERKPAGTSFSSIVKALS